MSATASGDNSGVSYSALSSGRLTLGAAIAITERLAELSELPLPSSLYKDAPHPPAAASVLTYLQALLAKDPAAFLARYGGMLQSQELNHFEALRSADWEVNYWLTNIAAQRLAAAEQAADPRRLSARVKNRRFAAMRRMVAEGDYFSEDAMRQRAPLLYHQQIGCFAEQEQVRQQQQEEQDLQQAERQRQEGQENVQGRVEVSAEQREQQQQRRQATEAETGRSRNGPGAAACSGQGAAGGMGGSCLAAALQAALGRHEECGAALSQACVPPSGTSRAAHAALEQTERPQARAEADGSGQGGRYGGEAAGAGPGASAGPSSGGRAAPGHAAMAAGGQGRAGPADILFSEFLMRQNDEAQLVMRRLREQEEEDAQLSEHESDDEDTGEADEDTQMSDGHGHGGRAHAEAGKRPSASELAHMRRDFVSEMEARFLLGQDGQYVDYSAIDADASLDADWVEEESRDAEEKYFDED